MIGHQYSAEEIEFMVSNLPGRSHGELRKMFNIHFCLDLSLTQITAACKNRKLNNGLDGCFRLGHIPANKGIKGSHYSPDTEFKKGNIPATHRPVGSEGIREDGYLWIKIAEPNKWRQKHVVLWEALHGPRPAGHAVIFADGNRANFQADNLILLSRKELVVMNKRHLIGGSRELTEAGKMIADIKMKTTDRIRKDGMKRGK